MAHQSDNAKPLAIHVQEIAKIADLPQPGKEPGVWFFVLPFGRKIRDAEASDAWFQALQAFVAPLHEQSLVVLLTSAEDAAETLPRLATLKYQLWVAIKLAEQMSHDPQQLPQQHAALLVLSKYRTALKHTKTRIAYTFCPACDKTTKDYGGKKHTYHEYGTLLSDVWRDIAYTPGVEPTEIMHRLADLFGLPPYRALNVLRLERVRSLRPQKTPAVIPGPANGIAKQAMLSQLINGDSLGELQKLPENSVDFCFADPPYNLEKRYDTWDDGIDVQDYFSWCDRWLDELARVLKPGRTCAVLNIPIWAVRHFQHLKKRLEFQAWIAWEGLSLPVRMIMPAHYAIVCFSKGSPRPLPGLALSLDAADAGAVATLQENYCIRATCIQARKRHGINDRQPVGDLWWDLHRLKHNSRRVDHPCQLPPALMLRLIALFTRKEETVLDPFNGAGTTSLCAQLLDRRYLGIELSKKYHELAQGRHELLQQGGDPFAKVHGVPKTKNSRVQRIGGMKYEVPKKELQLEVKRVAKMLGRMPSRDELEKHGRYELRYYDDYFINWGEVCAAARTTGMTETRKPHASLGVSQPLLFGADEKD